MFFTSFFVILHTVRDEYTGIREIIRAVAAGVGSGKGVGKIFGEDDFPGRFVGLFGSDAVWKSFTEEYNTHVVYPAGCRGGRLFLS